MVLNDEVIIYKNIFRFGKYLKSESYKDLVEELGILKVTNIYYIQGGWGRESWFKKFTYWKVRKQGQWLKKNFSLF